MSEYFKGKIKVLNGDFSYPVNPDTLDATACGYFEKAPYSWRHDLDAVETITQTELEQRREERLSVDIWNHYHRRG